VEGRCRISSRLPDMADVSAQPSAGNLSPVRANFPFGRLIEA
jgi:hypothetical protein